MTAFTDDPLLPVLAHQTDLLLTTARALDDAGARAASLLPGWSRGHVLTHLARNADALSNLARSAVDGTVRPMYASAQAREADIEAGAGRGAAELEADLESSSERLLALLAVVPGEDRDLTLPDGRGREVAVSALPWLRTLEVTLHNVDLDLGYRVQDIPPDVVRRALHSSQRRLSATTPGVRVRCDFQDGSQDVIVLGDGTLQAQGTASDVLAWCTGRSDGTGVTTQAPSLPQLPSWG